MLKYHELHNSNSCLCKARSEEMIFVLLARDESAPATIREWCRLRIISGENHSTDQQIIEALECAQAMEDQRKVAFAS